jgi:hypothetical protein
MLPCGWLNYNRAKKIVAGKNYNLYSNAFKKSGEFNTITGACGKEMIK